MTHTAVREARPREFARPLGDKSRIVAYLGSEDSSDVCGVYRRDNFAKLIYYARRKIGLRRAVHCVDNTRALSLDPCDIGERPWRTSRHFRIRALSGVPSNGGVIANAVSPPPLRPPSLTPCLSLSLFPSL